MYLYIFEFHTKSINSDYLGDEVFRATKIDELLYILAVIY